MHAHFNINSSLTWKLSRVQLLPRNSVPCIPSRCIENERATWSEIVFRISRHHHHHRNDYIQNLEQLIVQCSWEEEGNLYLYSACSIHHHHHNRNESLSVWDVYIFEPKNTHSFSPSSTHPPCEEDDFFPWWSPFYSLLFRETCFSDI